MDFIVKCRVALVWLAMSITVPGLAQDPGREALGTGDKVRIAVFQSPELTTEARISERGTVQMPLVGEVELARLTPAEAGARVAERLKSGDFLKSPQVTVSVLEVRSRQVTVLGQVNRPGKFALDGSRTNLTDILALAGGVSAGGADTVTILIRHSDPQKREINVPEMLRGGDLSANLKIENGDMIYVDRAPVFYIYGEVQRAGAYRLEPSMNVMQALAGGGGITPHGTERGLKIRRRAPDGSIQSISAKATDLVQANDVIYVRESFF